VHLERSGRGRVDFVDTTMADWLPPQYLHRYAKEGIVRRWLVTLITVAGKLRAPGWQPVSCVAEELALHAIVRTAEGVYEEEHGEEGDFGVLWDGCGGYAGHPPVSDGQPVIVVEPAQHRNGDHPLLSISAAGWRSARSSSATARRTRGGPTTWRAPAAPTASVTQNWIVVRLLLVMLGILPSHSERPRGTGRRSSSVGVAPCP
jgi:hypothetical protein